MTWLCTGVALAQNAPQKAEVMSFLSKLHELPGMRAEMASLGFKDKNLDLAMRQIGRVLGDRAIGGYVADQLLAAGQGRVSSAVLANGVVIPLIDRGMTHLTQRELTYFFEVEYAVIKALGARDCGMAFRNRMPPRQLAERTVRTAARLNTPALEEYYRIQLKAAQLGVKRAPRKLSKAAYERASLNLFEQVDARAKARKDGAALLRALDDLDRAGNQAACKVGLLIMETVLEMPAKARHEALLVMNGQ